MKLYLLVILCAFSSHLFSQTLELNYDLRHSIDPQRNSKNYPALFFEYFRGTDSGSLLIKAQGDLVGEKNNMGKCYLQISRSFRFWKPKIFLQVEYSGGLGVTEPKEYSYYLTNAFSIGAGHPFQWQGAFFNVYSCYTYSPYKKPSHDVLFSFYWYKGFLNYKLVFAGDFSVWTRNKNQGDAFTAGMAGKRRSFFAEPQLWYKVFKELFVGTRINCYYHVVTYENVFLIYPAVGLKIKL